MDDVDLETLIDQRATALVRQLDNTSQQASFVPSVPPSQQSSSGRGQIVIQFLEKRRRKGYFFQKGDEEVCWEQWTIDVTLAKPRTESGEEYDTA